jgi:hypothetical protein
MTKSFFSKTSSVVDKIWKMLKDEMTFKKGCHAEPIEACGQRPLRATLQQAQGDRPFLEWCTKIFLITFVHNGNC